MGKGRKVLVLALLAGALFAGAMWWLAQDWVSESVASRAGDSAVVEAPRLPDATDAALPAALPEPVVGADSAPLAPETLAAPDLAEGDVHFTLTGRVVDESGRPVQGAIVRHYPSWWKRSQMGLLRNFAAVLDISRFARTETDMEGRFALQAADHPPAPEADSVPSDITWSGVGDRVPAVLVTHPGFETHLVACAGWRGGDHAAGDVTLKAGASLTGRAVDEEGRPLAGVSVMPPRFGDWDRGTRTAEWALVRPILSAITGDDGRFAFDGLWADTFSLDLRGPGRRPTIVNGELAPGEARDLGDVVLPPGGLLEGQVVDVDGRPIPRAHVLSRPLEICDAGFMNGREVAWQFSIRMAMNDTIGDVDADADEQGVFRFDSLDETHAPYVIYAGAPGFEPVRSEPTAIGSEPLVLVLPRSASIVLTVVDPESGAPIPDATVKGERTTGVSSDEKMPLTVTSDPQSLEAAGVPPPHAGLYLLSPAGTLRNTAVVSAPGHATRGYMLPTVTAPDRASFRAQLPREARVSGLVVDVQDQPISDATVTVTPPESLRVDLPSSDDKTDAAGRFAFGQLAGGDWTITAAAPGFVPCPPQPLELLKGQVTEDVRLVLQPAGAIEGIVLRAGQPLPGVNVHAVAVSQAEAVKAAHTQVTKDAAGNAQSYKHVPKLVLGEHLVATDTEGRFRIGELPPEPIQLTGPPSVSMIVDVQAGETTQVTVLVRSKPVVRGRVSDAAGPVKGATLQTEEGIQELGGWMTDFDSGPAQSDAQGQFEIELARPGHYRFAARQDDADTQLVELDLAWDQTEWLDLTFPGGLVRGRVIEADGGAPVAGATVGLAGIDKLDGPFRKAQVGRRKTTTDADGRFEFTRVMVMPWAVFAVEDGHIEPAAVRVDVHAAGAPPEVLVSLQRGGIVAGRVNALNGAALPKGLRVRAIGLDAQPTVGSAKVQKDGDFRCTQLAPGRWRCELATAEDAPAWQAREVTVTAGETAAAEFEVAF